ncbi:MAG: Zn-dependent hydrolase [Rhodospirillales bacterium]|nr:Zn-dependent hydrolase [Rhodospirillales bacterium]
MTGKPNILEVDGRRLWDTLLRSGEIGPGRAGGLCRLPLTDSDKEMRDLFVRWCEEAGCGVTVDRLGNIFARRAGEDESLPPVLIGSHLDTQVAGGRYDGILGVLAGLEILRSLNDRGIRTRRPIELVDWTNEEGARFQPPMMCSAAFAGLLDVDWILGVKDDEGAVFGEELARIGYAGAAPVGGREIDAYFELHIEQGPELEAEGLTLGIVEGGYATRGMHLDIHGECAHSGPTPMDKRRNALVGAAMLICRANEIGWEHHPPGKSTAPRLTAWPNKAGILPSYAQLTVDFRHPDKAVTERMVAGFEAAIPDCATRANVEIEIAQSWSFGTEIFDQDCIALVEQAAGDLGVAHKRMLSQAGHDAYNMTRICPTALIFSPCKDGITHNEAEHIELDYTLPSVNVLLNAVVARANR